MKKSRSFSLRPRLKGLLVKRKPPVKKIPWEKINAIEDIPESQFQELGRRIKKAKGKVIVLVHPFYEPKNAKSEYIRVLSKLLQQSGIPVILLEDIVRKRTTLPNLQSVNATAKVLLLPTELTDSKMPVLCSRKSDFPDSFLLPELLERLGANNVFVGGMYSGKAQLPDFVAAHEKKWLPKNKSPGKEGIATGCVGLIYSSLIGSQLFGRVHLLPNAIWPEKPEYLKKF